MAPSRIEYAPHSVDEVLRARAESHPDARIFGYPSASSSSHYKYTYYTCSQLNRYAYRAAKILEETIPAVGPGEPRRAVALLGLSTVDYIVALLALVKLGHTTILMSTRISTEAYEHLIVKTGCAHVVTQPQFGRTMDKVAERVPLEQHVLPTRSMYDLPEDEGDQQVFKEWKDPEAEAGQPSWVIHSSGSTGLPKPIYRTNEANLASARDYDVAERAFCTLPLFHMYGLTTVMSAIYHGTSVSFVDAAAPITGPSMMRAMQAVQPSTVYLVPYALKLLAETPGGIDELKKPATVAYSGAACPKNLGNQLVHEGVNLIGFFGSTEVGALMSSRRDMGTEKDWDYMRPMPSARSFVEFVPQGDDLYELVVLDGWAAKQSSNREDGAYCTNDLFERHPKDPTKWRCVARKDDTIILSNGENANPIPFELSVRTSPHVKECIVYGQGRPNLIMLVVPDESVDDNISRADFVNLVWSRVELANGRVPTYSRISKDAIGMLPKKVQYPRTDKGTAIRQQFYKKFMPAIESIYGELQREDAEDNADQLALSLQDTREFIRKAVIETLEPENPKDIADDTDFFAAGLDSLQSLELRRKIRALDTGGVKVGQNVAFERPNINSLAKYLYRLRVGEEDEEDKLTEPQKMQRLIEKYSHFPAHVSGDVTVDGEHVVLTGATGSLGAQLAATLAKRPTLKKVYCLVRASSADNAKERVVDSLRERMVYDDLSAEQLAKLVCLRSDLGRDDLGLSPEAYEDVVKHNTAVIHNSWAVNFNMDITSFEGQHIRGVHNLIKLCLASRHPTPPSFSFASSVSAIMSRKDATRIPEELPQLEDAAMGYGGSKLVGEYICDAASAKTGMATRILRIGQLVGDSRHGLWNAKEAIPLTVQSAMVTKALPKVTGDCQASWLPTDVAAQTMVELALLEDVPSTASGPAGTAHDPVTPASKHSAAIFHVYMPRLVSWNDVFLPGLAAAGLYFKAVEQREWLRRLQLEPDAVKNPAIKLLDFFKSQYGNGGAEEPYFETDMAQRCSPTLAAARPVDGELVGKFLHYWQTKW